MIFGISNQLHHVAGRYIGGGRRIGLRIVDLSRQRVYDVTGQAGPIRRKKCPVMLTLKVISDRELLTRR
jgi:hypothetical protein